MPSVDSMLRREQRLEQAQSKPRTPFEVAYGSLAGFTAEWQSEIDAGRMDPLDGPIIIQCIRRWHTDRVYESWKHHRNGVWENK